MKTPTVGLLFYDDLVSFAPWISDRAPKWLGESGFDGNLLPPTIFPPPGLVLVCGSAQAPRLQQSIGWLSMSRRIVLVIDISDEPDANLD